MLPICDDTEADTTILERTPAEKRADMELSDVQCVVADADAAPTRRTADTDAFAAKLLPTTVTLTDAVVAALRGSNELKLPSSKSWESADDMDDCTGASDVTTWRPRATPLLCLPWTLLADIHCVASALLRMVRRCRLTALDAVREAPTIVTLDDPVLGTLVMTVEDCLGVSMVQAKVSDPTKT